MDIDRRDRHLSKRTTVRPDPEVKKNGLHLLRGNGWTLNDFVQACLALVTAKPAETLHSLEPFRPPPKKGRPRSQPG